MPPWLPGETAGNPDGHFPWVAFARVNARDDDLAFAGAARQAEMVRRGEVSSRELVELYLRRIERFEPELNAFRTVTAERALADADQADGRRRAGGERALLGVPMAVKDTEAMAGEPTARGTAADGGSAQRDNDFISRLRAAGAVILGKTNLPELAIMGDTEGPAFGVTRNPWNSDRSPGGSSGGSAAAVAAGLCAAATGSDGVGSIRIPAANCGLVGLKPQRDRISLAPVDEHWYGLSVAGFLTRTVADTALLMDATARTPGPFAEAARRAPGRLRVALSLKPPLPTWVDGQVKTSVSGVADALRALGHEVTEQEPAYGRAADSATIRYLGGIAQDAERFERPERLQRRTRGFARLGRATRPLLAWSRRAEAEQAARINELFDAFDVLLTPVNARPPVKAAQWEGLSAPLTLAGMAAVHPFTGVWNLTGQPAIAVPGPPSKDGLPIGAQLVGPPASEERLLSLAGQLEAELGWPERRPPLS
jgi:amidase